MSFPSLVSTTAPLPTPLQPREQAELQLQAPACVCTFGLSPLLFEPLSCAE